MGDETTQTHFQQSLTIFELHLLELHGFLARTDWQHKFKIERLARCSALVSATYELEWLFQPADFRRGKLLVEIRCSLRRSKSQHADSKSKSNLGDKPSYDVGTVIMDCHPSRIFEVVLAQCSKLVDCKKSFPRISEYLSSTNCQGSQTALLFESKHFGWCFVTDGPEQQTGFFSALSSLWDPTSGWGSYVAWRIREGEQMSLSDSNSNALIEGLPRCP